MTALPPPHPGLAGSPLAGRDALASRVRELAREVAARPAAGRLVLVGVLHGALPLLHDLSAAVDRPHAVGTIAITPYRRDRGEGVRVAAWPRVRLAGSSVVVVDDLVETGLTLRFVARALQRQGAASVSACVLFDRPYRRLVDGLPLDHVGFVVPDCQLVGYGADSGGSGRELADVWPAA